MLHDMPCSAGHPELAEAAASPLLTPSTADAPVAPVPLEMRLEALPRHAPEPPNNRSSPAKIVLGRMLFFDPILSATREVACATCHHPSLGWTDQRATPIGVGAAGLGPERIIRRATGLPVPRRNTPTLLNVAFNGLVAGVKANPAGAPMFWDSRARSLESQALVPIQSPSEMLGERAERITALPAAVERLVKIPGYRRSFRLAFPAGTGEAITPANIGRAIAAFERMLTTPDTPFDRFLRGATNALTDLQKRGLRVFSESGCVQCHGGPMLSDFKPHFIGAPDSGPDSRVPLRTPTLRNLKHTAPYMHNGRLRTLNDVFTFYEQLMDSVSETLDGGDDTAQPPLDPLLKHLTLSPEDFPALEAFLDSLNAVDYDATVPATVPSGLPVAGVDASD